MHKIFLNLEMGQKFRVSYPDDPTIKGNYCVFTKTAERQAVCDEVVGVGDGFHIGGVYLFATTTTVFEVK